MYYSFLLKEKKKYINKKIKYKMILYIVLLLLIIWFFYYPALRYGGYHLFFISIFLPLSIFIQRYLENKEKLQKKISTLIVITLIIFFARNIDRLIDENKKYSYNPFKDSSYRLLDKSYRYKNFVKEHIKNKTSKINEVYKGRYLIIN
ncbi:MAG: hypothetical protein CMB83_01410 [Flammeovirgaceae bacterium]|nr:hypothetical protein [Flammeovirgaceae bacterium]